MFGSLIGDNYLESIESKRMWRTPGKKSCAETGRLATAVMATHSGSYTTKRAKAGRGGNAEGMTADREVREGGERTREARL